MKKHKKYKKKIRIYYMDGKSEIIPQKFWDDYEYINNNFVVKKDEKWVGIYNIDAVACIEVW